MMRKHEKIMNEFKAELRMTGRFYCTNKSLWEQLYQEMKSELPSLHRVGGKGFFSLKVETTADMRMVG